MSTGVVPSVVHYCIPPGLTAFSVKDRDYYCLGRAGWDIGSSSCKQTVDEEQYCY